jgi:hypothetical protein
MRPESRKIIHIGINFVFTPPPVIDHSKSLDFQKNLIACGIEFSGANLDKQKIDIICKDPEPLQITVNVAAPQVGQLVLIANQPGHSLEYFNKKAEAVVKAFHQTWPEPKSVITRDATIRNLFETESPHSFQELWEKRLGQPANFLQHFGRPVLGGGLRLVMAELPTEPDPLRIEIKYESFLMDLKKFFIETQFVWPKPGIPNVSFDPENRLNQLDEFIKNNVVSFIMEPNHGPTKQ